MQRIALYIVLILAALLANEVLAQTRNENLDKCKNSDTDACTALIDSGEKSSEILAIAYLKRGAIIDSSDEDNRQKAIADLEQAFRLKPTKLTAEEKDTYYEGYQALRLDYFFGGQREKLLPLDKEAMRLWPDRTEPYENLADDYRDAGKCEEVIATYSEGIRIQPNNAWLYGARGRVYLSWPYPSKPKDENKIKQALSDITKSIELGGTDIHDYFVRAELYEQLGEYDKAIADYDTLIRLDNAHADKYKQKPDHLNYSRRGEAYYALKQYDKALVDFKESQRLQAINTKSDDMDSTIHYDLGNVYNQMQQYEKAIVEYSTAIDIAQKRGEETQKLYKARSKAYHNLGQSDNAAADADKARGLVWWPSSH